MTIQEIREKELNKCREKLLYFVRSYGHIEDRDSTEVVVPFELWDAQADALEKFKDNRRSIVLKARQLGISWLVLHYAVWVMLKPHKSVIGLSENEEKAKELVRRMADVILTSMPELVAKKGEIPPGWKGMWFESTALSVTIHFPDGESTFKCFASSENAGRSFTADLIIFDEWAFQQFDRQIYGAALPTINRPNGGQIIGVSTIKRGSLFEELFCDPNNTYTKIFIPWYADPRRDEKWYEDTKKDLPDPATMTAEYPATIEEALTVPGGAYFPEVVDESIVTNDEMMGKKSTYFFMDYGLDKLAAYWVNRDPYGNFQIVHEHYQSNLTVGEAASLIFNLTNRLYLEKSISRVVRYLAPPDLWNRHADTGKSTAILFSEQGISLTKTNNDIQAGCYAMKELLKHEPGMKSKLTILRNCAPNLLRCLKKIQRDEKRPNIYAKEPHELTHSVDALRYLAIYWTHPAEEDYSRKRTVWREDQYEDYENASEEDKKMLIDRWGEPA